LSLNPSHQGVRLIFKEFDAGYGLGAGEFPQWLQRMSVTAHTPGDFSRQALIHVPYIETKVIPDLVQAGGQQAV
jgi:hypothetical protein